MRAFPLHLFRPLAWLLFEAEKNHPQRAVKSKKLITLFNLLYASQLTHSSSWEDVTRHAELLGALIYEINAILEKTLKVKGHSLSRIEQYQENLLRASTPEKISTFLQQVVAEMKFQPLRAA